MPFTEVEHDPVEPEGDIPPHVDVIEEHHPGPRQYVGVAVILALVTAIEVAIYYIDAVKDWLVPLLICFSLIKFVMVVAWFMHLRFDSHLFRRLFITGLILALVVFAIVLAAFFAAGEGPAPTITTG
jgi:cytochrome c oxidase subunit IV